MIKQVSIPVILLGLVLLSFPSAAADEVGHLRTRVDPSVAGVFIDGEYYGTVDMFASRDRAIELKPGEYKVEIKDPRYKTLVANVTITPGNWAVIRHSLEPLPAAQQGPYGELITEGFGNAALYLNGQYYTNTSAISAGYKSLLLPPGEYEMRIVPVDGGGEITRQITINADEALVLSPTGAPVRRR